MHMETLQNIHAQNGYNNINSTYVKFGAECV